MTDDHTTEESPDSGTTSGRVATEASTATADAGSDTAEDESAGAGESTAPSGEGNGGDDETRDVVVPMRVYKAVTVFTTLFAVVTVVGGFVVLDSATNRARASFSEIDPLLALVGVGLIVAGAAAYAFSTRFRAEGMGKSKDDTDEDSDNG